MEVDFTRYDPQLVMLCETYLRRQFNDGNGNPAENGEWALVDRIAPRCQVVFDVGACTGDWTRRVLAVNPLAEVHCFEPFPANLTALEASLGQQARIVPVALADREGEASFWLPGPEAGAGENLGTLVAGVAGDGAVAVTVPTLTMGDYCAMAGIDRIDLVKIDAEGAEMTILRGALPLLAAGAIGMVQIEYGATWIAARSYLKDLFDLTAALPYRVAKLMPDGWRVVEQYHPEMESFRYANWLLIRHPA